MGRIDAKNTSGKIRKHCYGLLVAVIAIVGFKPGVLQAQDPQFSQFYSNSLYLAPSFAGLSGQNKISLNYRDQWAGISNGYKTYSFSYDHYFANLNSGLGVLLFNDVAGTGRLRTMSMALHYAFDFRAFDNYHVRPGMYFGYMQTSIDFHRLLWGDQISTTGNAPVSAEPNTFDRVGDIDFGFSVLSYSDKFWLGFSADHMLNPNKSLYEFEEEIVNEGHVPAKYQVFGGGKYVARQRLLQPIPTSLQLAFLYKQQNKFTQFDMGLYWYRSPLVLGIWYRGIPVIKSDFNNDAVVLLVGYKNRQFSLGYSYDFTISRLIMATQGSHEVSMSYIFSSKPKKKKYKIVPCPEF